MKHSPPPPGCLRELTAQPSDAPDLLLDTLTRGPNRFYSLSCRCRSELFTVMGEPALNELIHQYVVAGRVRSRCNRCMRTALLFDPSRDGCGASTTIASECCA